MEEVKRIGGVDNFSIYRPRHIRKGDRWIRNPSKHNLKLESATTIEAESPLVESVASCVQRHGGRVASANGSELPDVTFHGIDWTRGSAYQRRGRKRAEISFHIRAGYGYWYLGTEKQNNEVEQLCRIVLLAAIGSTIFQLGRLVWIWSNKPPIK